jgi:translation initiation factor 2 subunit 2
MEAFEKELKESAKDGDEDEEDGPRGEDLEIEGDIGDDVFALGGEGAPAGIDSGSEPWLGSDRDYFYNEVCAHMPR